MQAFSQITFSQNLASSCIRCTCCLVCLIPRRTCLAFFVLLFIASHSMNLLPMLIMKSFMTSARALSLLASDNWLYVNKAVPFGSLLIFMILKFRPRVAIRTPNPNWHGDGVKYPKGLCSHPKQLFGSPLAGRQILFAASNFSLLFIWVVS